MFFWCLVGILKWNLIKICVRTCDMNSTLDSVVPLLIFLRNSYKVLEFKLKNECSFINKCSLVIIRSCMVVITLWNVSKGQPLCVRENFTWQDTTFGWWLSHVCASFTENIKGTCSEMWAANIFPVHWLVSNRLREVLVVGFTPGESPDHEGFHVNSQAF